MLKDRTNQSVINTKGYALSVALLVMIAVASTLWLCNGVDWFDDLQYKRMPGDGIDFWLSEGPIISSFSDACEAVPYHFTVGSSRLPNLVQVFFNLLPPFVVDLLHGLMVAVFMFMVVISVGGKRALRSPGVVGLSALAVWVLLPWYDHMLPSVCLLNYVWVSAVALLFIMLFYSDHSLPQRWKALQWLVAIVVGLTHEGITFPIIGGAILTLMVDKRDRRRRVMLTSLMAFGAVLLFLTPGMMYRLGVQVEPQTWGHLLGAVVVSSLQIIPVYILLAVTAIAIWRRGVRYVMGLYRQNLIYVGIIVAGYVIAVASVSIRRGLWFVELASIVLMFKVLFGSFGWWRRPNLIVGAVSGAFVVMSIMGVAMWQSRFSAETVEMCRQVEKSGKPVAYIDLTDPGDAPWWTFNIPQSIASTGGNNAYCRHYRFIDIPQIMILPAKCENTPASQWDTIPGTAKAMGQFPFIVTTRPTGGKLLVEFGGHQSAANPCDILLSRILTDDRVKTIIPAGSHYWRLPLVSGDTIYCHNINILGHTMRHREIISIDTVAE